MSPRRRPGGFTLIELLTVLVILAVVAAVAMPTFRDLLLNQRLSATASDLMAALQTARNEAIKKSQLVTVRPTDSNWDNGWSVSTTVGSTTSVLSTYEKPAPGVVRDATLGNGFANAVSYDANGFARDADGKFGGSGCVTFKADTQRRISVIVSASGRPRTCDPDKTNDCGSGDCDTGG